MITRRDKYQKAFNLYEFILHFCSMNAIKRLIPNLFTAGNLVGGILAIIFALTGKIHIAPYFIFASAIFDFLDGFIARILKVPSELGKQLDSLADMVTFGVAPGIIVYVLLQNDPQNGIYGPIWGFNNSSFYLENMLLNSYLSYIAFLIPVFALFRLAKFNLDTRQSDSFIGLPTPAMTLFFAVIPLLAASTFAGITNGEIHPTEWQAQAANIITNRWFLVTTSIVLSILMVVELPLFALKFKDFKFKGNQIRYIFLTISILLLATLFFWAIPLIIILYVILSLINTQIAK
jgi:CDP-diacylglycerol--serine O-phosphatidyltransferase